MSKITQENLEGFNKDDLFVLGRNIYQAACGNARNASNYLEDLQARLGVLQENVRFHLLNGVLYEIYFDSAGRFRTKPKSNQFDAVFRIEESEIFRESFMFVRQALRPHLKNLFYVPSTAKSLNVDVSCIHIEDDLKTVEAVFFEGDNVLHDGSGENYFDPTEDTYLGKMSRSELKDHLSNAMVVPSFRLKVNFLNLNDDEEEMLFPYSTKIKRLSN